MAALLALWLRERPAQVELIYEFPVGFVGRFIVSDSGEETPPPDDGDFVVRIPASGEGRAPISQLHILDKHARFADGTALPAHAFFYHHVPDVERAAWLQGKRQIGNGPWQLVGFVGSWKDAEVDRKKRINGD